LYLGIDLGNFDSAVSATFDGAKVLQKIPVGTDVAGRSVDLYWTRRHRLWGK